MQNFKIHVTALSMTKSADGLLNPKLVLTWLMTSLGAPAFLIGLLVPIREAGALLPQILIAQRIKSSRYRKGFWIAGSVVQGLSVLAITLIALMFQGVIAGVLICLALAIFAVARSFCSASYKDVLGKTVDSDFTGRATGLAGSISAISVLIFAVVLLSEVLPRWSLVITGLVLASCLWVSAAMLFKTLDEPESIVKDASDQTLWQQMKSLWGDAQFVRFVVVRGLLTATALAPPYLVILDTAVGSEKEANLGALLIAPAAASFISSYVWGALSDKSSRMVLIASGFAAGVILLATVLLNRFDMLGPEWSVPLVLFVLMVAYQGVRLGRDTHLVDMGTEQTRAAYTAVSNTIIGVILLGAGVFGALASLLGTPVVLLLFATMSVAGAVVAIGLDEAQQ